MLFNGSVMLRKDSPNDTLDASGGAVAAEPESAEAFVTVYDAFGRSFYVPKAEWYQSVIPGKIKEDWENADSLYSLLVSAHPDGQLLNLKEAFDQFLKLDKDSERAKSLQIVWLLESGKVDEAKAFTEEALKGDPDSTVLTCHLAEIYERQEDLVAAKAYFLKALEQNPNQQIPLVRYLNLVVLTTGEDAYWPAVEAISNVKGSWLAQLFLARKALQDKDLKTANDLYQKIIPLAKDEHEVLTMISGDLGQAGYVEEMIKLVAPLYNPNIHGISTGTNLLNGYFEIQDFEAGQALLKILFSQVSVIERPFLMQQADRFDQLRAMKNLAAKNAAVTADTPIQLSIVVINEPMWYYGLRQPNWLMPGFNPDETIGFMLFSTLQPGQGAEASQVQQEDHLGRLSRSLPLYLMESFRLKTTMKPACLIPVVVDQGPIVYNQPWVWDEIVQFMGATQQTFKYLVTGGLAVINQDEAEISLTLWDVAQGKPIQELKQTAPWANISPAVCEMEAALMLNFQSHWMAPPPFYDADMRKKILPQYAVSLGQLLILFLIENGLVAKDTLWGERRILDYMQELCLSAEDDTFSKFLYLSALAFDKALGSSVYEEYVGQAMALFDGQLSITHPLVLLSPLLLSTFNQKEALESRLKELAETGILQHFPTYDTWSQSLSQTLTA